MFGIILIFTLVIQIIPTILSNEIYGENITVDILQGASNIATQSNAPIGSDSSFSPSYLCITVNDTVIWKNQDISTHSIAPLNPEHKAMFPSKSITFEEEYPIQFTKEGVYEYYDEIYPFMKGVVNVTNNECNT